MAESKNNHTNYITFDPFVIGSDHNTHSLSTSIIKLEESGKVFCPLCLENVPLEDIEKIEESLFTQYVENLFEALDQNHEENQLRRIVLVILGVILKKRSFDIKSDYELHNILRILYKIMNSERFNVDEFQSITRVFMVISTKFTNANHVPLISIWKASQHMLNYAENYFAKSTTDDSNVEIHSRLFGSLATIIKTYLGLVSRFTVDQLSDLIFPIREDHDSQALCRKNYTDSQRYCLKFIKDRLMTSIWSQLMVVDRSLTSVERLMVGELFGALRECFSASLRLKTDEFLELLKQKDCPKVAHSLILRNTDRNFRRQVRQFLKLYVFHYVESEFGRDKQLQRIFNEPGIVETNYKNALVYCNGQSDYARAIFYILVNCIALKHHSSYFNRDKVKKVIKCLDPVRVDIVSSRVLLRAYVHIVSSVVPKLGTLDNVEGFFIRLWKNMRIASDYQEFDETFCFDEVSFYWAYETQDFIKLVTPKTVKYFLERSLKKGTVTKNLLRLLKSKHYKNVMKKYFKDDESAEKIILDIVKTDHDLKCGLTRTDLSGHHILLTELSAFLPSLFHETLLESINGNYTLTHKNRIQRLMTLIVILMKNCCHFDIILDNQFVVDLFELVNPLYESVSIDTGRLEDTLITFNEFIVQLMVRNDPCLMKVLYCLNYTILGYMYHLLADYTGGDRLVESIAHLLVAYADIDYPLELDVNKSLCQMALSCLNWSLSKSHDMHILSLRLAQKVLDTDIDSSTKACIATGIIHMLVAHPTLIRKRDNFKLLLSILHENELKYNPLINHVLDVLNDSDRNEFEKELGCFQERSPSPAFSFSSASSSGFEEEQITVSCIIAQLHKEGNSKKDTCRIPNSLFVSRAVQDQHSNSIDTNEWELRAYEANKQYHSL